MTIAPPFAGPAASIASPRTPARRRVRSLTVAALSATLALPALLPVAGAASALPGGDDGAALSLSEWSDRVWSSAKRGDLAAVERYLDGVPEGRAAADVMRLRSSVETLARTREEAAAAKAAELEKALADMRTHVAEKDIAKALADCAMAKSLSDDWNERLASEEIQALVATAAAEAERAEDSGDWLLAQELLFRLRQLHDQSDAVEEHKRVNEALEDVNRRIGLLAEYAPHKLHELRRLQAARLEPDKEFPAFNEAGAEDWKEQLRGITQVMLMAALRQAATEHIDNEGWWPLLTGGLQALRILATTEALSENFPGLRDPQKVRRWVDTIDELERRLDAKPRRAVSKSDYRDVIGRLIQVNRETVALPEAVLFREFGDGATYKLSQLFDDQYTEIIWPERLRRFQQQTEGNFVGVGILIRQDEKREIVVVNPLEGSPAYRAGVKPEDRIVSVDGVSTLGWSLNRAVDTITGPRGREVVLGVRRGEGESEQFVDIPIVRDTIKIRSVNGWWKRELDEDGNPRWDWLIDPISRIGYVRLTSFNEDSYADFLTAYDQMRESGPVNGLILDLRFNPGGLLKSAVEFSNLFVPRGEIVAGQDKDGTIVWRQDAQVNRAALAGVPTVVLINEGSASASEIVAGCLQAHGAAVVLGERTFGKGSVQTVHDVSDGQAAAVKLTTQYYVLPPASGETKGRLVHRRPGAKDWGVNPDIHVPMTPQQVEASMKLRQEADTVPGLEAQNLVDTEPVKPRPDVNELLTKGIDPQLQTALLILQARAIKNLEEAAVAQRS